MAPRDDDTARDAFDLLLHKSATLSLSLFLCGRRHFEIRCKFQFLFIVKTPPKGVKALVLKANESFWAIKSFETTRRRRRRRRKLF